MRRIVSVVLILCILLSLCVFPAMAAEKATVSISSGTVKAGEEITLTVSIEDNPGLAAFLFYIYYDTSVFSVDPRNDIALSGKFVSSNSLFGNDIATAKGNGGYDGLPGKDGVMALWFNLAGTDITENGSVLTIKMLVNPDAANGSYTIEVGHSSENCCNEEGREVKFSSVSGTITVTGGTEADPEETPEEGETTDTDLDDKLFPDGVVPEFQDVDGHWAQKYIEDAAALGLIQGYNGLYRPNDTMTRAECVTILWRANGAPTPAKKSTFLDLDPIQSWYHEAVAWAEETGVMNGVGNFKFDPNGKITREQLATILFREAGGQSGMELMFSGMYDTGFTDSGKISSWAKSGLYWSVYNEVYCGTDRLGVGTALNPQTPANRAQIAVMMVRYLALMEK